MVNSEFDTLSTEDTSFLAFGLDEEMVEDPETGEGEVEQDAGRDTAGGTPEPVCDCFSADSIVDVDLVSRPDSHRSGSRTDKHI